MDGKRDTIDVDPFLMLRARRAIDVAREFCAMSDWTMRPHVAHGMTFLAQGLMIARHRRAIVREAFHATDVGPRVPCLVKALARHGAQPVPKPRPSLLDVLMRRQRIEAAFDAEERVVLADVYAMARCWGSGRFVRMNNGDRTPWAKYHRPGESVRMPTQDIARWARHAFPQAKVEA